MEQERWRKVEELFHAALERTPEARQAFLDGACNGDTDLRRQVDLLLAKEKQAGSFLERPAIGNMPVTLTVAGSLLGQQFGPYQIVSALGAGGMGEVYRAHDSKLGRDVAIKTLPHEFARDPERLSRFRREARTLASLNHPNIAAIYGLEESGEADCLVLELVEGETLRGPLPVANGARLRMPGGGGTGSGARQRNHSPRSETSQREGHPPRQGESVGLRFGKSDLVAGGEPGPLAIGGRDRRRDRRRADRRHAWVHESGAGARKRRRQADGHLGLRMPVIRAAHRQARLSGRDATRNDCGRAGTRAGLAGSAREDPREDSRTVAAVPSEGPEPPAAQDRGRSQNIEKAQRGWNRWRVAAIAAAALAMLAIGAALWLRNATPLPGRSQWVQLTKFPDSVSQPALSPDGRMVAFIRGDSTFFGPGQIYVKILPGWRARTTDARQPEQNESGIFPGWRAHRIYHRGPAFSLGHMGGSRARRRAAIMLRNASGLVWTGPRQVMFSEIRMGVHMAVVAAEESRIGAA